MAGGSPVNIDKLQLTTDLSSRAISSAGGNVVNFASGTGTADRYFSWAIVFAVVIGGVVLLKGKK